MEATKALTLEVVPAAETPGTAAAPRVLPIRLCEQCGEEMHCTSPRQKFCEVCRSPERKKERHRIQQAQSVQRKLASGKEQADLLKYANTHAGMLYECFLHVTCEQHLGDKLFFDESGKEYLYDCSGYTDDDFVYNFAEVQRFVERGGLQNFNWKSHFGTHRPRWVVTTKELLDRCFNYLRNHLHEVTEQEWCDAGEWEGFWDVIERFPGTGKRLAREYRRRGPGDFRGFENSETNARWEQYLESVLPPQPAQTQVVEPIEAPAPAVKTLCKCGNSIEDSSKKRCLSCREQESQMWAEYRRQDMRAKGIVCSHCAAKGEIQDLPCPKHLMKMAPGAA